jgi:hypothetical protein
LLLVIDINEYSLEVVICDRIVESIKHNAEVEHAIASAEAILEPDVHIA